MRLASKLQFIIKKLQYMYLLISTVLHLSVTGLTKTLVYSTFEISFNWNLFHKEIIRSGIFWVKMRIHYV